MIDRPVGRKEGDMKHDDIKDGKWAYNFGGSERWNVEECFDTEEETIAAAKIAITKDDGESFEVGQIDVFKPCIDAEAVIEYISEKAWNESEGYVEDYLKNLPKEEIDRLDVLLNEALNKWLDGTNNHPGFYTISSTSVHFVEQRSEDDAKSM